MQKRYLVLFIETFIQDLHLILRSCKSINMYCFLNESINSDESFIEGKTVLLQGQQHLSNSCLQGEYN